MIPIWVYCAYTPIGIERKDNMKKLMRKIESVMEIGGTKKDITFLAVSAVALICSIFHLLPLPFDPAWAVIILCGVPIVMEAVISTILTVRHLVMK